MKSITKKILAGLLLLAILSSTLTIHAFADDPCMHSLSDGKCSLCGEVAKKVTLSGNITLYNEANQSIPHTDGVYSLFTGDVVFLKQGRAPEGMYFDGWKLTTDGSDHVLAGNRLCIGSSDITIEASFNANKKVNIVVNAPLFRITGLSGMQLGAASLSPLAGTSVTVSYAGTAFMPNSEVIYWINENGMIVGLGNEITLTISTPTTVTAICNQGTAGTALVVYRNGAERIGTKIISYLSASENDVASLSLPANASVGTLNVIGWKIAGTDEPLTQDAYRAAVSAAIESGSILYLEPAIAKSTVDVAIHTGAVESTEYELLRTDTVYANEYVSLTAPAMEGVYFSHWEVNGEIIESKNLIYKFEKGVTYTVVARYGTTPTGSENAPTLRLDTDAPTGSGKIYLNGIYQIPEGYTLTDAGIVYTTNAEVGGTDFGMESEGVKVRKASGLEGKESATYNLTLNTSKDEVTVWARAFVTFLDADNRIVTVYTDVEVVVYTRTAS